MSVLPYGCEGPDVTIVLPHPRGVKLSHTNMATPPAYLPECAWWKRNLIDPSVSFFELNRDIRNIFSRITARYRR